jgi:hypothetical protein
MSASEFAALHTLAEDPAREGEVLEALVRRYPSEGVMSRVYFGRTRTHILATAILKGLCRVVNHLLTHHFDARSKATYPTTDLHWARGETLQLICCWASNPEVVRICLAHGMAAPTPDHLWDLYNGGGDAIYGVICEEVAGWPPSTPDPRGPSPKSLLQRLTPMNKRVFAVLLGRCPLEDFIGRPDTGVIFTEGGIRERVEILWGLILGDPHKTDYDKLHHLLLLFDPEVARGVKELPPLREFCASLCVVPLQDPEQLTSRARALSEAPSHLATQLQVMLWDLSSPEGVTRISSGEALKSDQGQGRGLGEGEREDGRPGLARLVSICSRLPQEMTSIICGASQGLADHLPSDLDLCRAYDLYLLRQLILEKRSQREAMGTSE